MRVKLNNQTNYEHLCNVTLTAEKFPIAFSNKVRELTDCGMTEEDAVRYLRDTPIELELYYSYGYGLFAVETDAIDGGAAIFDPYTGTKCDGYDVYR